MVMSLKVQKNGANQDLKGLLSLGPQEVPRASPDGSVNTHRWQGESPDHLWGVGYDLRVQG